MPESTKPNESTEPATMRAARYLRYGGPDVVSVATMDKPQLEADRVLVRVHAAAVNPLDWHYLRGLPYLVRIQAGLRRPKRTVLGADLAGTVEAVGADVTRFAPGDEVFGDIGLGAFAEYAAVREGSITTKPAGVSFTDAASIPIAGLTALQGLRDKGNLEPGQRVLVHGASGGVGTFAIQIAKALGAHVTAVCSARNADMVRSIGADGVVDYTEQDVTRGSDRFDLILDTVATHSLRALRRILNEDGTCVRVGAIHMGNWFGPIASIAATPIANRLWSQNVRSMLARVNSDDLEYLGGLLADGSIKAIVDRTYSLDEIADAIRYVEHGHAAGKVLIAI